MDEGRRSDDDGRRRVLHDATQAIDRAIRLGLAVASGPGGIARNGDDAGGQASEERRNEIQPWRTDDQRARARPRMTRDGRRHRSRAALEIAPRQTRPIRFAFFEERVRDRVRRLACAAFEQLEERSCRPWTSRHAHVNASWSWTYRLRTRAVFSVVKNEICCASANSNVSTRQMPSKGS